LIEHWLIARSCADPTPTDLGAVLRYVSQFLDIIMIDRIGVASSRNMIRRLIASYRPRDIGGFVIEIALEILTTLLLSATASPW
jgi:hypothetical protein